jgi:FkbM family methyltransferase
MSGKVNYYLKRLGVHGLFAAVKGRMTKQAVLLAVNRPDVRFPFFLRVPSTDVSIYDQIFIRQEYALAAAPQVETIVDAGANIGLASIYFANAFPNARIIAIEAEGRNYEMLKLNTKPYEKITAIHAALWDKDERISVVDLGLGNGGFVVQDGSGGGVRHDKVCDVANGITMSTIMEEHHIDRIGVLKIDIEGAEVEVFSEVSPWLDRVDCIMIELHEQKRAGCNRRFYNATNGFHCEWTQGENVCVSRSGGYAVRVPD